MACNDRLSDLCAVVQTYGRNRDYDMKELYDQLVRGGAISVTYAQFLECMQKADNGPFSGVKSYNTGDTPRPRNGGHRQTYRCGAGDRNVAARMRLHRKLKANKEKSRKKKNG